MLDINVPLFLIHTTTFLAAMCLIWVLFLKPLLEAMNRREATAKADLDGAAKELQEAEKLRAKLEQEFKDSRAKIKKEMDKAVGAGEDLRKQLRAKAQSEAEALLKTARAEITEEKDKAVKALRGEAAGLAVAIAEKLLDAEVDEAKHKQLIDKMVGKV
jgi:F-type H+-transporting ATPase subunit b